MAHDSDINCIQVSLDGKYIGTGGNDKQLVLFDNTGCQKMVLSGCLQGIMGISFDAVSDCVLGASNDNSIKIWNLATARLKVIFAFSGFNA